MRLVSSSLIKSLSHLHRPPVLCEGMENAYLFLKTDNALITYSLDSPGTHSNTLTCTLIHACALYLHTLTHTPHTIHPSHTPPLTQSTPHTLHPSHNPPLTHSTPHTLRPSHNPPSHTPPFTQSTPHTLHPHTIHPSRSPFLQSTPHTPPLTQSTPHTTLRPHTLTHTPHRYHTTWR